jgi:hypothetical protein
VSLGAGEDAASGGCLYLLLARYFVALNNVVPRVLVMKVPFAGLALHVHLAG